MLGSKRTAKLLIVVLTLMLLWLTSMTGCSGRYVVVAGDEEVVVKKAMLDQLMQDNELLLKALEECQNNQ